VITSRVRSGVHVPTYIQTYIATYVHTYIHRYIHIYIRVYFVDYICKLIFYTSLITPCLKTWDLVFLAQFFTRCSSYLKPKHDSALDSWRDPRGQLIRLAYSSAGLWRKGKKKTLTQKLWRKSKKNWEANFPWRSNTYSESLFFGFVRIGFSVMHKFKLSSQLYQFVFVQSINHSIYNSVLKKELLESDSLYFNLVILILTASVLYLPIFHKKAVPMFQRSMTMQNCTKTLRRRNLKKSPVAMVWAKCLCS
jgi:hypothetical protein